MGVLPAWVEVPKFERTDSTTNDPVHLFEMKPPRATEEDNAEEERVEVEVHPSASFAVAEEPEAERPTTMQKAEEVLWLGRVCSRRPSMGRHELCLLPPLGADRLKQAFLLKIEAVVVVDPRMEFPQTMPQVV